MEFKEFSNPESKDYDITSSLKYNDAINTYSERLIELIGILEDVSEEELQENYGISLNEYLNPNEETIRKVEERLNIIHR